MLRQFALFALVGGAGFVVDAGVLLFLVNGLHANVYVARVVSWLVAATFTWRLNRSVTFRSAASQGARQQWLKFLAASLGGGLINLTVSTLLIAAADFAPVPAVACGSLAGLLWNFVSSRQFVFAVPADGPDTVTPAKSAPAGRPESR
ncbi:MAG TPA: GtrA family protein [Steroidobacteraceae bacterium]|nr:GtrA family protein [Steroidobacteraceae bacterium]